MLKKFIASLTILLALMGMTTQASAHEKGKAYQIIFQVNDNDPKRMNLVLNNVRNVMKHFQDVGQEVEIEVVAYGPGLHMLRDDTSPVKKRINSFAQNYDNVKFAACANTIKGMTKKEGKKPKLMDLKNVTMVPAGVIHILDRQDQGWHYLRP